MLVPDIPPEFVKRYLKKSGDDSLQEGIVECNEKGFLIWTLFEDKFVILHTYGDGLYWDAWANNRAKELGCKTLFFGTKRNPKAFERRLNYKLVGYIMEKEVK